MFLLFLCDLCVRSLCLIFRASLNMDYASAPSWIIWSAECTRFLWVFESICFFTCLWNYDLSRTARGNNLYGSIWSRSRCSCCSRMYSFCLDVPLFSYHYCFVPGLYLHSKTYSSLDDLRRTWFWDSLL